MTQAQALDILKTGANVFLTGEPGAGKTYVINEYVEYLRAHEVEPSITASTGIAATHIHGQTIHSWSGIGIRRSLSPYDLEQIGMTEYIVRRVRNTAVLIIDEISMIDAGTLDMVDQVCREVRQKSAPFGGIQVILVGDFFQLPPIGANGEAPQFAFLSNVWRAMNPLVCYITEQHRQQADGVFLSILSAIRDNTFDTLHHDHLLKRKVEPDTTIGDGAAITRLFPHNANVDTINDAEIKKISGSGKRYTMTSKGSASMVASLKKGCLSPEVLELKIGAAVMCTKNNREKGFANGTLGTVVGFSGGTTYPIIETRDGEQITIEPMDWAIEEDGKVKAMITQIPLRLAWAITIHKSQGMSLDAALMDLSQVFEYGQGYVALSRVRSLEGLHLLGWNPQTFLVHPTILEKDSAFHEQSETIADTFGELAPDVLEEMHNNFIKACGGTLEKKTKEKEGKTKSPKAGGDTLELTLGLVLEGKTIADIAKTRSMTFPTIVGHVEKLIDKGRLTSADIKHLFTPDLVRAVPRIRATFLAQDTQLLAPVHEALRGEYSYDQLRLARLAIKADTKNS